MSTELPDSARTAKSTDSKYYFTGLPCVQGHISKRLVATRACYECHLEHVRRNNLKKNSYTRPVCNTCDEGGVCTQGCTKGE